MINYENDLREIALNLLDSVGVYYKKKDDTYRLLIRYYTFCEKYIFPKERVVYMSEELQSKIGTLPTNVRDALIKIQLWVETGEDINCFQSKGLYGKGSRDYQNALYGVIHLHLSASKDDSKPVVQGDRFSKRSEYLLFAKFQNDAAYFIDVLHHPEDLTPSNQAGIQWTSSGILLILENNWPELIENTKIPGATMVVGAGKPYCQTDLDIAALTANGITTFVQGKDGLYLPNLGVASSGDSTMAVKRATNFYNKCASYKLWYDEHYSEVQQYFGKMLRFLNREIPDCYDVHIDLLEDLNILVIRDRISGVAYEPEKGALYYRK